MAPGEHGLAAQSATGRERRCSNRIRPCDLVSSVFFPAKVSSKNANLCLVSIRAASAGTNVEAQFLIWLANSDFFSDEIGSPVSTARISSAELLGDRKSTRL